MTAIDKIITPTPERLKHANDNFVSGHAVLMQDAPIDRLLRAGEITEVQHQAGLAYYADWYAAGMAPLGAVDYSRVIVDGSKPELISDHRMSAQDRFNQSRRALTTYFGIVVDAVVLGEQGVANAGKAIGINNRPQARAVAMDRLREGLGILAVRYGLAKKNAH
jgi:hypothetical protein